MGRLLFALFLVLLLLCFFTGGGDMGGDKREVASHGEFNIESSKYAFQSSGAASATQPCPTLANSSKRVTNSTAVDLGPRVADALRKFEGRAKDLEQQIVLEQDAVEREILVVALFQIVKQCFFTARKLRLSPDEHASIFHSRVCSGFDDRILESPFIVFDYVKESRTDLFFTTRLVSELEFARFYKTTNHPNEQTLARELLSQAKNRGEFAAQSGNWRALLLLANAFREGLLEDANGEERYRYLLIASHGKQMAPLNEQLLEARSRLTENQAKEMEKRINFCLSPSGSIVNPFG